MSYVNFFYNHNANFVAANRITMLKTLQLCTTSYVSTGNNETSYYLNDHMCYLEFFVELIKVYSAIEHQSAETYPWK